MIQDDNSIPLLTEVIPVGPPQVLPPQAVPTPPAHLGQPGANGPDYGAAAQPGAFHTAPSAASYQAPAATPAQFNPGQIPANATPAAEQYRQWEQEIRENVLQSLLTQADTVLQQHLQDQMAVVLDNLSDILTQRVKDSLHAALAETVTRAVAEEMARFSSLKK
ncbi:hypothetical protein J8I26_13890 [Herbaspirillum sp. LeCh32-8]|uniref:hypothetical protein n=1 Tax=Herbaspirillum sp. LeCh32-8 TaxID=2821356 RepID=UPI001AE61B51|nr:hypothetical protein [Herbaspirillum sp. LeCh32-8]MBP0599207.1 hypothetical protein [Herbaspirillum sp. LeCh32-8]